MKTLLRSLRLTMLCAVALVAAVPAMAANIVIVNNNAAGVGFNDPTPRAPVGGNPGTTLGAQRLFIFQYAASIWSNILPSTVQIRVRAQFAAQTCTATSATLGSAGTLSIHANFTGAPLTNHWYNQALANKLFGADLNPGPDPAPSTSPDINATFNLSIDSGCFGPGQVWYYGIDGLEGTNIELLPVVLHELGHGLGFQTFTTGNTGAYNGGLPSISDHFLYDNVNNLHWDQNTAAQRAASTISVDKLSWDGPNVTAAAATYLSNRPVLQINSPGGIAGTYPVQTASFGAPVTLAGLTGNVVLADDGIAPLNDGCEPYTNAGAVAGNIALVDRGLCTFVVKAQQAQAAGAVGLLVANNVAAGLPGMGGVDPSITIPCVGITQAEGNAIKANLGGGVNVTIHLDPTLKAGADNAGRVLMYAPNPFASGSSVSHYDISVSPNVLMEPAINPDLHDTVDLTVRHFQDLGWFPAEGVTLVASPSPSACGQPVTLTATVSPSGKGTVEFFDGATSLGSVIMDANNTTASLVTSSLAVGNHSLTAKHQCFVCPTPTTSAPISHDVNLAASSVVVSSDVNPSSCGQKVNFTATVTPATAAGTVEFFDGANSLGTAPVSGGVATLSVSDLTVGAHGITGTYSGDGCNGPSTSGAYAIDVAQSSSSTALTSDINPSLCGQKVTLTATVTPATAGGIVTFYFSGGDPIGSAAVSNGVATLSVTNFIPGSFILQAAYEGDDCYGASTSPDYKQLINETPTSTTLASDVNPSTCGAKVTLAATVTPAGAAGNVTFYDGATPLGVSPLDGNGLAQLSVTTFMAGSHSLTAAYDGDGCYAPSTSAPLSQQVDPAPTTTTLTSDINPSACGVKVFLNASVPVGATGTVTFLDGGNPIGSSAVDPFTGVATLSVSDFTVGTHTLTASYSGDGCYLASVSPPYDQVVAPAGSSVTVTSDINPSLCGQKVTFTASVEVSSLPGLRGDTSARRPTPSSVTGIVTFYDGPNPIGAAPLDPGTQTATLSVTSLQAGSHVITATYSGNDCYVGSTSPDYKQTVNGSPTTTSLASGPSPAKFGSKVTLTATVSPPTSTGTVEFFDGATSLGTAPVSGGTATLSVTTLGVGVHSLTAAYSGNGCAAPSVSGAVSQTIIPDNPPVVTVVFPNGGENFLVGQSVKYLWTATDDNEVVSVTLSISRDLGATWQDIAVDIPNTGSFVWTVTGPGTNTGVDPVYSALLRAVAKDNANQTGQDNSNPFSIYDFATETIVTRLDAQPASDGIAVRWTLATTHVVGALTLERATVQAGPWTALAAEQRAEGDLTVAVDRTAEAGRGYWYRLVGNTSGGGQIVFGPVKGEAATPAAFALSSAWPNPMNKSLHVNFSVAREAKVRLSVIDVTGREMAVLAEGTYQPGRYQVAWDGRSARGAIPAGVYFLQYTTPEKKFTSRIVVSN